MDTLIALKSMVFDLLAYSTKFMLIERESTLDLINENRAEHSYFSNKTMPQNF